MRNVKRFMSLLLSAAMLLVAVPTVLAAESGFSDVASGVWYTDAVNYVAEHNLMDPVSGDTFAPDAEASRAALAVALYRAAGSPVVEAAVRARNAMQDSENIVRIGTSLMTPGPLTRTFCSPASAPGWS